MIKKFDGAAIRAISAAVPRGVREMRDFLPGLQAGTDIERLIGKTGVERVRVAKNDMTASDLCRFAAEKLFRDLELDPSTIDGLVFASTTPDSTGSTSTILQFKLGLPTTTPCFDLAYSCTGYIYALLQASLLITSGTARRVLLLAGQTNSKRLRKDDRSTLAIFGDGGSASLVEASETSSILISTANDGSHAHLVRFPNSGFRKTDEGSDLIMDGAGVFAIAARELPGAVQSLLAKGMLSADAIDWFAFHQASKMLVDFTATKLSLDPAKVLWSLSNFGNTSSASIPLTLVVNPQIRASSRRNVLLCGLGSGLSWGGALIDLSGTHMSTLVEV